MGRKNSKRERDSTPRESEAERPIKRPRQEDSVKLAKLYNDLAAESDETRLDATKRILAKFSPKNNPSAEAAQKTVTRLILGLCSRRKAARFGFFVALTELLRQIFGQQEQQIEDLGINVDDIVVLVGEKTKAEGNVPGEVRRDHLIGKLFGYKAIMQSTVLFKPEVLLESWNKVLDHVYEMARDIPWLREECGLILVEAVKALPSRPDSKSCAQELVQRLVSFKLTNTPEGVAIWLTVRNAFDNVLPTNVWHAKDPLCRKERARLAKVLKEDFRGSSRDGDAENIKSAAANQNPIFTWNLAISEILRRDSQEDAAKGEFSQFWLDTVDNNLFSSTASHERKSWGFKLFATLVTTVPESDLPALFSQNLMRSLINQSKKDDRLLHKAALAALDAIQIRVQQSPALATPIFVALTSRNGTIGLDKITKTKTLEHIMSRADDKALRKIVRHLHSLILRPETQDQITADSRRQTIADMFLSTVRNYKRYESSTFATGQEHDNWLRRTLDIMVESGYFVPTQTAKTSKVPLPPIGDTTRRIFQERLASCLTRLLTVETESRTRYTLLVVDLIRTKATSSKTLELVFKADASVIETIDNAVEIVKKVTAKHSAPSRDSAAEGLKLLYSLALLQVYNDDTDAVLLLDELESSSHFLLEANKSSSSRGQDAFVEILLTFLSNPRILFRKIAQEAFTIFAPSITLDGLRSLTEVLDTAESLEGQRELFEQEGETEIIGSEDGSEDVEEASDVEMINGSLDSPEESDGADSESYSDDDTVESSSDHEDDDELIRFNNLLAHALKTSKPPMDGAGSDDSSDDGDMDDEQMMALDPHLAKIFQERSKTSSKKKERADAKQTVVQFKSRILDLLSIFAERKYSDALSLEIILPALRRIRAGSNKHLIHKSYGLLKNYTDTRSHHRAPLPKPDSSDAVWEVLGGVHEEAKLGGGSSLHATACSNASLHLVKVLVGKDKQNYSKVVDVYAKTQKEWFMEKESAIQPVLFTQFHNWSTSVHKQGK